MKIDTKPLGISKSSIEVSGSLKQVDMADEVMISLYEIDANRDDMVKGLQAEREAVKKSIAFFKAIFGLSEKETKKVYENVPYKVINNYLPFVCGMIKGAPAQTFSEFEASVKEQSEAPKLEQSEKPEE